MPRFITQKWIEVHDQSGETYNANKQIRFKTSKLRSVLCDYRDAYIVVKGIVTVRGENKIDRENRFLAFKNNPPFTSSISNINNTFIDNAENLHIVMPMYNLIEYSRIYSKTSGTLWNYYKDISTDPIVYSESFKYKSSITGKTIEYNVLPRTTNAQGDQIPNPDYNANKIGTKEIEIIVQLKHLSNFWRTLDMPLINCEVSLTLKWSNKIVLTDLTTQDAAPAQGANPTRASIAAPTGATFKIIDTKLYVPVVTLSAENDKKLLEKLKTGFKKTITWNKYRSK